MDKKIWYFEDVDLYQILCPYKMADHLERHPMDQFQKGDFIFLPDDLAKDIYLIAEGQVKIGYYDDEGNEHIKAILGKGELLGEIAYLETIRHKDFAQSTSNETQICKMSATKARELSRDYVPFALQLNKRIAQNIQRLERKLEILFHKDARQRLEELLKDLFANHPPGKVNDWVQHGLSQKELADLIGSSRKTVSLLLNTLEREGFIEISNGKFRYKDSKSK